MTLVKSLLALFFCLLAAPAFAGQAVELTANPVDATGHVTLGELFDGAGAAANVVVAERAGPTVVLDAQRVQAFARQYGLDWANARGVRRIIVRAGAGAEASAPGRNVEVLTYARSLATGEVVQPQDLIWAKAAAAPVGAPRTAEAVIGLAARRALREGDPVSSRDVAAPMVIKAGDTIEVIYRDGGITLTLQARALANAAAGDSFNVLNTASKKTIEAVAVGPGQAVVGPEAQAIKAQRNPSQFAAR